MCYDLEIVSSPPCESGVIVIEDCGVILFVFVGFFLDVLYFLFHFVLFHFS